MTERVPDDLREFVRRRAGFRCEYCHLPEDNAGLPHEIEHIIASKHGGLTEADNLAWACGLCNRHKGSDIASIDYADRGQIVRLFHPRRDRWDEHFRFEGGRIEPLTAEGRVTVFLLQLNKSKRIQVRRTLRGKGRLT
jgi:hypothetical protein